MALIEWQDEFSVGVPDVDYEHKALIHLINKLHDNLSESAAQDAVSAFLGEINAEIAAHFALEESIMRIQRYDHYEAHKADHERLLDDIREIMDSYESGAYTDYEETLAQHLRDWFMLHFKTHDARLHTMSS